MPMVGVHIGVGGRRLSTGGGSAPVSDPIVQSINADGRSVTTTNNPPTMDPDGAGAKFLYAIRKGYDASGNATTFTEKLTLSKRIRQPYPNQASLTTNQVGLSKVVYVDDVVTGITNNSTKTSPKPIVQWARWSKQVLGNTFPKELLEVVVAHRNAGDNKQVACVTATLTDGTTTINVTNFVQVVSGYTGDKQAVVVWRPATDIDISTLTDATITQNAKAYPRVGVAASIADSSLSAVEREFSPRTYRKNVALAAAPRYVYVSTAGNDTSGVGSTTYATAKATPCLTVLGAINKAITTWAEMDNVQIVIGDDGGTPFVMASTAATRAQNGGECTITRDPLVARANARVSFGAAAFRPRFPYLKFGDVQVVRTGIQVFTGEASSRLRLLFENFTFDNAATNAIIFSNSDAYWMGGSILNPTGNSFLGSASAGDHRLMRGVTCDLNSSTLELWTLLGCDFSRPNLITAGSKSASGGILAFSKISSPTNATCILVAQSIDVNGFAILQNVFEWTSSATGHFVGISNDSQTANSSHVVIHNNTFVGFFTAGRGNLFYDEGPTARTNELMSLVGNIHVSINTKGDVFRGANEAGPDASTRVGNWSYLYGVDCWGEFSQFIDANNGGLGTSFAQEYPGLKAKIGTSNSVRQDPLFTNYQGTTSGPTAGAGGGDYTLQAGSPCIGMNSDGVLAFDLTGNARSATASAAGAYERLAA